MSNDKKTSTADGLTRRGFLTLGGVAALGAGAALAGCSPQASSASGTDNAVTTANAADSGEGLAPSPWGDYYPWPANPPEITDDMVEEELDCDVAVVGLGVSGVAAFRAASEGGAKVVGIEKGSMPQQRSSQYCYLNGKLTDTFGLPHLDLEAIIKEEFQECASITNYNIVRKFVLGDAEAMDWWIEGAGCEVLEHFEMTMDPNAEVPNGVSCMSDPTIDWENEPQAAYPECVNFTDHQAVLDNNFQKGLDAGTGSEAYFGHFAEALIQNGDGRVVGVYARNADTGKYKKINAKNGVCLASGCCRSNEDMVRYFAPNIIWNGNGNPWPNMDVEGNRTNTGDGYKLGYWAGASIQQYQCSQMHVMGGPGDTDSQNDSMGFTGPLLRINYNGERFMNEDTCAADAEYPIELQPKHKCFMITDGHFEENAAKCGGRRHHLQGRDSSRAVREHRRHGRRNGIGHGRALQRAMREGRRRGLRQAGEIPDARDRRRPVLRAAHGRGPVLGHDGRFGIQPERPGARPRASGDPRPVCVRQHPGQSLRYQVSFPPKRPQPCDGYVLRKGGRRECRSRIVSN